MLTVAIGWGLAEKIYFISRSQKSFNKYLKRYLFSAVGEPTLIKCVLSVQLFESGVFRSISTHSCSGCPASLAFLQPQSFLIICWQLALYREWMSDCSCNDGHKQHDKSKHARPKGSSSMTICKNFPQKFPLISPAISLSLSHSFTVQFSEKHTTYSKCVRIGKTFNCELLIRLEHLFI